MRVIAGCYRGQRLQAPDGLNTRPILDRVKVSLFDWLGARLAMPGSLPPLRVLDLFCGGGSLGIEALSRGVAACTFVETDRDAFECLRKNLDQLGVGPAARAIRCPAETVTVSPASGRGFDLIFLDPPYSLSEDLAPGSTMSQVLARLGSRIPVDPEALVIWRHDAAWSVPGDLPNGWRSSERRMWSKMAITLLERAPRGSP